MYYSYSCNTYTKENFQKERETKTEKYVSRRTPVTNNRKKTLKQLLNCILRWKTEVVPERYKNDPNQIYGDENHNF